MQTQLILASASPRRRELLAQVGAHFDVICADADESAANALPPRERVAELARIKCAAVAAEHPAAAVIGADTMVLNAAGELLGKPRDAEDARKMLTELSGGMNIVYTGVCVMREGRTYCGVEETRVFFRTLEPWEIEHYIASGEPMDKAGAYGIQGRGALLVQRIEGDYFNVVGLPLVLTAQLLSGAGYRIWSGGAQ